MGIELGTRKGKGARHQTETACLSRRRCFACQSSICILEHREHTSATTTTTTSETVFHSTLDYTLPCR